jgi:hypothetical protein
MTVNYTIPRSSDIVEIISTINSEVPIFSFGIILFISVMTFIVVFKMSQNLASSSLAGSIMGILVCVFFIAMGFLTSWTPLIYLIIILVISIIGLVYSGD